MAEDQVAQASRDQRRHRRVAFDAEIDVEPTGEAVLRTYGVNLSSEGACFTAPHSMQVGGPLRLRFSVGERRFALRAQTRHTTNVISEITGVERASTWVVGVQFVELSADEQSQLDDAVDELRELEGDDDDE
jgi:hypothetical protein